MKTRSNIYKMVISAMMLALAYVLPFLTGQVPEIGSMLCPMHIPVLLCGFFCGWYWGLGVGITVPLFRSLTLGAPVLFPMATAMAFELGCYGAIAGLLHKLLPQKRGFIYVSLLSAMLLGRCVWGIAMLIFTGAEQFGFSAFILGAFTNAVPGIILQIVLVPLAVALFEKTSISKQIKDINLK